MRFLSIRIWVRSLGGFCKIALRNCWRRPERRKQVESITERVDLVGAEAKPKPGKPLCVKPATNLEKLQTSVEKENTRKPAGTLQEICRNPQETSRKPAKKPADDPWKTWKICSMETCAEIRTKPMKHLGQENLQEALKSLKIPQETIVRKARKVPRAKILQAKGKEAENLASKRQRSGIELRSLDSEYRVLTVTYGTSWHPLETVAPLLFCRLPNTFPCFAARKSAELRT